MPDCITTFSKLVSEQMIEIGAGRPRTVSLNGHDLPVLRVADVLDGRIESALHAHTSYQDMNGEESKVSRPGDIVLTTKGTVGRVALMPADGPVFAYSPQLCFFRPAANGPLRSRFLYYWFKSAEFWIQAKALKGQTDMADFLSLGDIQLMRIRVPPLDRQDAVAGILGALDDKMAANQSVVDRAEELAAALASRARRRIPLGEIATQSNIQLRPGAFNDTVAHFSLPAFDDGANPSIEDATAIKSNKFVVSEPAVLISKLNPRIPRLWDICSLPKYMALASTEFVVLIPAGISSSVLWAVLREDSVTSELAGKVAGTSGSHQRVKPGDILALQVGDPSTLDDGTKNLITRLGQLVQARRAESIRLTATRDELLPLLMSGRIRVRDAEKIVEEAV